MKILNKSFEDLLVVELEIGNEKTTMEFTKEAVLGFLFKPFSPSEIKELVEWFNEPSMILFKRDYFLSDAFITNLVKQRIKELHV